MNKMCLATLLATSIPKSCPHDTSHSNKNTPQEQRQLYSEAVKSRAKPIVYQPVLSQTTVPLQTPSDGKQWFASRTTPPWNITLSLVIRERVTSKHPLVGNPRLPITLRQYYKWLRSFWSQFISLLNVAVCYFRVWASFLNCRCCSTAVKTGWVAIVRSLLFGPVF